MNVLFIRHGHTDYTLATERQLNTIEENFIPLSPVGVGQAERTSTDQRLRRAEIVLSSPYTRALQTAAIINVALAKPLFVEFDLREWKFDTVGTKYLDEQEIERRRAEFFAHDGTYPSSGPRPWEPKAAVIARARNAIAKYSSYGTIIVVAHGMLISCLTDKPRIECGAVLEHSFRLEELT